MTNTLLQNDSGIIQITVKDALVSGAIEKMQAIK